MTSFLSKLFGNDEERAGVRADLASSEHSSNDAPFPRKRKRVSKIIASAIKILLFAFVVIWIVRSLQKSWTEIVKYDWEPQYGWLILSGFFYLIGYFPSAAIWFLSLRWLGQKPEFWRSVKAFYCSQLGKYVPGKAATPIIRTAMVRGPNVRTSVAVVGVFYETLTMMGSGAFIAAIIVSLWFREHWFFSCLALGVAVASTVPLFPPIFVRIIRLLRIGKDDPQVQESLGRLRFKGLLVGFFLTSFLWVFFGLSLGAAIRGIGIAIPSLFVVLPRLIAVTALATTLGLAVAVAPGGLGIREAILSALLIPFFTEALNAPLNANWTVAPESIATIVSLVQRIVSITAEISIVACLIGIPFVCRLISCSASFVVSRNRND